MKYCTNCGRQLADDEVCTCRQQAQPQTPNQTQDNNAQADNAAQQAQFNGIGNDSCHFVIHHIPFTSVFIFISIGCPEYSYLFSNLQILCSAHPSQENNIVRSLLHSQTPLPSHSLHIVRILIHDLFLYIKIVFPFQTSEL